MLNTCRGRRNPPAFMFVIVFVSTIGLECAFLSVDVFIIKFVCVIGLVSNRVPFDLGGLVVEDTSCTELFGDPSEESDILEIVELF